MTRTPAATASSAATCTVSSGVSSCSSSTLAWRKAFLAFRTSAGVNLALAPEATAMLFSPFWPTKINATPEGLVRSRTT